MERERILLMGGGAATCLGLLLPFAWAVPNRVAPGVPVRLDPLSTLVLLGSLGVVLLLEWKERAPRLRPLLAGLSILVPWILLAVLARLHAPSPPARINPGTGFFAYEAAGIVLLARARYSGALQTRKWGTALALLGMVALLLSGALDGLGVMREFATRRRVFLQETAAHLSLSGAGILIATLAGIPLGILAHKNKKAGGVVFSFTGGIQTIPSLALFGLLIAPLAALSEAVPVLRDVGISGLGNTPALIALSLYALLPIVRTTAAGLSLLEKGLLEAARGMGLSPLQRLFWVEIPVSLPVILAGLRTASVQVVGTTTVAALIGAGGFGRFIFQGLGQSAYDLIALGVLPTVLLSLGVDRAWALVITCFKERTSRV
ncbi:ABC transporter permease [Spirochaeta thermophila]|uniref:Glycine betaine/L-proline ABC transporter, permease n=1 Tax=Winmispira thermophila (strain ATCC 49972 / DSM 6192 / RI 19.B1) TaxID=665571 RepID=E0RPE7_WINT6|nr:ABC transporter permease [Spirochaeta thermophila]ADN02729.1 glycine betaine/L-proline ABC transporter, permease [Spirochaeta thermophila DSM 6192]